MLIGYLVVDVSESKPKHKIKIAIAGPGKFVRRARLPRLRAMSKDVGIGAVLARRGHTGVELARQYGAEYAATSFDELLNDPDIDAVLIGTRHNPHGNMVLEALRAGKHVFVEKPLALTEAERLETRVFAPRTAGSNSALHLGVH